jgi:hypothetical protein
MATEPDLRIRIKGDPATKTLVIEGTTATLMLRCLPTLALTLRTPRRHWHRHDEGGVD